MLSAVSRGSGIDGLSEPYRRAVGPLPTSALGPPPPGRGAPNRPAAAVSTPPILASAATAQKRTNATISYPRLCPASSLASPNAVRPGEVVYTSRKPLFASSFGPVPHVHDVKSLSQMNEMLGANFDVHKGAAWQLGRNIFHVPTAILGKEVKPSAAEEYLRMFLARKAKALIAQTCLSDYFLDGICLSIDDDSEGKESRESVVNVAVHGPAEASNASCPDRFNAYSKNNSKSKFANRPQADPFSKDPKMTENFLVCVAPRLFVVHRNVHEKKVEHHTFQSAMSTYKPSEQEEGALQSLVEQCKDYKVYTALPPDSSKMVDSLVFAYFELLPTSSGSVESFLSDQGRKQMISFCTKLGCVTDTLALLKRTRNGEAARSTVTLCVDCRQKESTEDAGTFKIGWIKVYTGMAKAANLSASFVEKLETYMKENLGDVDLNLLFDFWDDYKLSSTDRMYAMIYYFLLKRAYPNDAGVIDVHNRLLRDPQLLSDPQFLERIAELADTFSREERPPPISSKAGPSDKQLLFFPAQKN